MSTLEQYTTFKTSDGKIVFIENKSYNPYRDASGRFASGPSASGKLDYGKADRSISSKYLSDTYGKDLYKGAESKSIQDYANKNYIDINTGLRKGNGKIVESEFSNKSLINDVENIDNAMSKVKLKSNTVLYRGAANKRNQTFEVGQILTDHGYSSTSLSSEAAEGFLGEGDNTPYVMKITAPKGTNTVIPGLNTGASKSTAHEVEVLLPRNTSYKITKVTTKKDSLGYDYNLVEADVVNSTATNDFESDIENRGYNPNRDPDGKFGTGSSSQKLKASQERYRKELKDKTFYHGTNTESASIIEKTGFKESTGDVMNVDDTTEAMYGPGVYLTDNKKHAETYAKLTQDFTILNLKVTGKKVWDDAQQDKDGLPTIVSRLQEKNPDSLWGRYKTGEPLSPQDWMNGGGVGLEREIKSLQSEGYDVITFYPTTSFNQYTETKQFTYTLVSKPSQITVVSSVKESFDHDYHHIEAVKNKLDDDTQGLIQTQQSSLQNSIMNIEAKLVSSVLMRLFRANNAFGDEANLLTKDEEESFRKELAIILAGYYGIIIPLFGKNVLSKRAQEFGQFTNFKVDNNIKKYIKDIAAKSSSSHIKTLLSDLSDTIIETYNRVVNKFLEDIKKTRSVTDADLILARKKALEGASQQEIINAVKKEYSDNITRVRAKTIARTETNRAFTQSQFQADLQFIKQNGYEDKAYKKWVTRSDNPCAICINLASQPPIPFETNFADIGDTLTGVFTNAKGKIRVLKQVVSFEDLAAGNAHVNCACRYILIIENDFIDNYFSMAENRGYNPNRDSDGKFGTGSNSLKDSKKIKKGTVFYHGTTKDNAKSILENGYDQKLNQKGYAESPYGLFVSRSKESNSDHAAGSYGDTILNVKVDKNLTLLDANSQTWLDTMGQSRSAKESAVWADKLKKIGYDGIDENNDELLIWNTEKVSFSKSKSDNNFESDIDNRGYNPNRDPDGKFGTGSGSPALTDKEIYNSLKDIDTSRYNWQSIAKSKAMAVIAKKRGFDKKPKVVTDSEYDKLDSNEYYKQYRGIAQNEHADKYRKQLTDGEYYAGVGDFGSGIYTTSDKFHAYGFTMYQGESGPITKLAISKKVKYIDISDSMSDTSKKGASSLSFKEFYDSKYYNPSAPDTHENRVMSVIKSDPGVWAINHGYDAITIGNISNPVKANGGTGLYINVLNRGKLTVSSKLEEVTL